MSELLCAIQGRPFYELSSALAVDSARLSRGALPFVSATAGGGMDSERVTEEAVVCTYATLAARRDISTRSDPGAWLWLNCFLRSVVAPAQGTVFREARSPTMEPRRPTDPFLAVLNVPNTAAVHDFDRGIKNVVTIPLHYTPESSLFINTLSSPRKMRVWVFSQMTENLSPSAWLPALRRVKSPLVLSQRVLPTRVKEALNSAGAVYFDRLGLSVAQSVVDTLGIVPCADVDEFALAVGTGDVGDSGGVLCAITAQRRQGHPVLVVHRESDLIAQRAPLQQDATLAPAVSVVPDGVGALLDCIQFRVIVALCILHETRALRHPCGDRGGDLVEAERASLATHVCREFVEALALASRMFCV